MSNDDESKFGRWIRKAFDPWHDTLRSAYYLLLLGTAAITAIGYVLNLLLQHVIVPHWKAIECYGHLTAAIIAALATVILSIFKKDDYAWAERLQLLMPAIFPCLAVNALYSLIMANDVPPDYRRIWWHTVMLSGLMTPIAMLNAVYLIALQTVLVLAKAIISDEPKQLRPPEPN